MFKVNARGKPSGDRPYCWQEKAVRRAIRQVFDADGQKASALCIYDALCEIASNEQSDRFTASHDKIASFAGLVGKTSKRIMPTFEKMKIVHVQRNGSDGLQTPSTYTLLPCPDKFYSQGLKVPAQGQKRKSDVSHVLNNPDEQSPEKSDDDDVRASAHSSELSRIAAAATDADELIKQLRPHFPDHDLLDEYKRHSLHRERNKLSPPTARSFLQWLKRAEKPLKGRRFRKESNRNTGTLNEGKSHLYRGVGKVIDEKETESIRKNALRIAAEWKQSQNAEG